MKREQTDPQLHIAHDDETEKLRQWWKRNGTGIIAGVVIGIGGVGGIHGWRMYQDSQAGKASVLYEQMLGAAAGESADAAASAATALVAEHGNSGYADIARLMLARLALESGDTEGAKNALNELLESTSDPVMRQVARVRLAVIALKDGDSEQIRALARAEDGEGFSSHFQELLGDALVASGDFDGARQAYQEALRGVAPDSQAGRLITAKLNMTRKGDDG
ncbi:MAG TPA: hypothetical protein DG761_08155 [Gammaproteobacteria bacterium]|jgi:predicted negative regulator of RcsB-dependent stress response|nr:tetratricopeptide repeat protein [Arenicellales bacterium]MDP6551543.1 tetratricopeptide repeat protein [Arenicellales bacterium]MDP6790943.1 tetratricopeptide repeat protein [Arenicellales bacterium]MDP6918490.1 tetratricopeptide repeat protein [Arenicellales bacterium]HCX87985.1 hypothetical protein [Gammaproteobacteria bacterium]|tara:strand:+ start:84 stop:746 length:663 start_codon:yes stop_codon:yes gene_type:complete